MDTVRLAYGMTGLDLLVDPAVTLPYVCRADR
jgi:hypothetical protein